MEYRRYNVELSPAEVQSLMPELTDPEEIAALSSMDAPDNMPTLYDLGKAVGAREVRAEDFPAVFDVTLSPASGREVRSGQRSGCTGG